MAELVVKRTGNSQTLVNGDVRENNTLTMAGKSRDGKVGITIKFVSEDMSDIQKMVPTTKGARRIIEFNKVNQTLDDFKTAGAIQNQPGIEQLSPSDQEAYDARMKAALDIQKQDDTVSE